MRELTIILAVVGILFGIFSVSFLVIFLFSKINKKTKERKNIKESKKETSKRKKWLYINLIMWFLSIAFSTRIFYILTGIALYTGFFGGPLPYFILILPIYMTVIKLKYFRKLVKEDKHKLEVLAILLSTLWVVIVGLLFFLWNKVF